MKYAYEYDAFSDKIFTWLNLRMCINNVYVQKTALNGAETF